MSADVPAAASAGAPPDDPPWTAERVVDAALCRVLAREQLGLAATAVELFGAGWDNTAFLVDGEWIVRFPRRAVAVPLLETETALLPRLARGLPVRVPLPEKVGAPSPSFPWPFAAYRRLPGRTLCEAAPSPEARAGLAAPLGELLAALHGLDPAGLALPGDRFGKLDVARLTDELRTRVPALAERGLLSADHVRRIERRLAESAPPPGPERRAVHGDLYSAHLLLDDRDRLCGVIDWGDLHLNHPAVDLSAVLMLLPAAARPPAIARCGEVSSDTWRLAGLRGLFHCVTVLGYAADIGNRTLAREAALDLGHVLQPLP